VLLKTIRESVDVGVMDEGMVAISPGELLGPEAKVIVGNKWRRIMLVLVGEIESRKVTHDDDWTGHDKKDLLPHLPAVVGVGARHLSQLAQADPFVLGQSENSTCEGSHAWDSL